MALLLSSKAGGWIGSFKVVLTPLTIADAHAISALWSGRDSKIIEIDDAVRFRPYADLSRYRCRQSVLQIELAVQVALDFRSGYTDFQILPLPARGRRITDPLHARALALFVFEQHQIIFERIGPDKQVVAVGL